MQVVRVMMKVVKHGFSSDVTLGSRRPQLQATTRGSRDAC